MTVSMKGALCAAAFAMSMSLAGCSTQVTESGKSTQSEPEMRRISSKSDVYVGQISEKRLSFALLEVKNKQRRGQRVWCVPFARDASGINIMGDAREWWGKAAGTYDRNASPRAGSVMTFKKTRKNPNGHVAVVSKVISDRKIMVSHANWKRNKVSLDMVAVDVSKKNDWSEVRFESAPGSLGSVYPVQGFIHPVRPKHRVASK